MRGTLVWGLAAAASLCVLAALPARAQPVQASLTVAEVQQVIAAVVQEANARSASATIAITDRVGNVLGVFQMNGATARVRVSTGKGIARTNGLEEVQNTFAMLGANGTPSTRLAAIAKAVTGSYLSSGGNAFTTRTASQIVQEHFNVGEKFAPSGPLFGVQFSQLPCSDLSTRFAAPGAAMPGLVSATVGPKRSPLGLSADPGGIALYKNGVPVGAVGVEANGIYTIDPIIVDYDFSIDEILAAAGSALFPPPSDILASKITVDGKTLRYLDNDPSQLATSPATAPAFATINGVAGNLVAVPGYNAAVIVAGQAYGAIASGFAQDNTGTFDFVGQPVYILYDGAGNPRFAPRNSVSPATGGGGGLTANEVTTILGQALRVALAGRAQIRRPLTSPIQVTISVVDANGNILGIARTADGPVFGTDVSLQKARSATFFSATDAATNLGTFNSGLGTAVGSNLNGVPINRYVTQSRAIMGPSALADGFAYGERSIGNLARPFLPDGLDYAGMGPLSVPIATWSPFNTGLQLDLVIDNIAAHLLFADGVNANDINATCTALQATGTGITRLSNGLQIFPGGVPIYRGNQRIGGIGVSGDGIDQDDMISFLGLHNGGLALGNGVGNAPPGNRVDRLILTSGRLRYVACPFKPFIGSRQRNVCDGK